LVGLLMLADPAGNTIGSGNTLNPKYHRYDFESACGVSVFRVRFRNGPMGRSRVDHVLVDGRPVPGAARTLDRFAARRAIERIQIMHCGKDPRDPVFGGIMVLSKPETQPASRQIELFFHLVRTGEGWRITLD
jgi:hypothetical protein